MTVASKHIAVAFLEEIQKECLKERFGKDYLKHFQNLEKKAESDSSFDNFMATQLPENKIEELNQQYRAERKHARILKTRFELTAHYSILKHLFSTIERTAEKLSMTTKNQPFIGTALSKEYNAFAYKIPDTEDFLIVFEAELFTLANMLSKVIVLSLPDFRITSSGGAVFSFRKKRIVNHIKTNVGLQEKFADLVYNAIFLGQPNRTKKYFLEHPFMSLHFALLNSLELFVVGHEYGHILSGHLDRSNILKKAFGRTKVNILNPDWDMEYEADMIGLTLLLHSLERESLFPFSYLGPELFFTFLDLDERANNLFANGNEQRSYGSEEHPPIFDRRKRIRKALKTTLPKDHMESYTFISKFLEEVMEALWDNYKAQLIENAKRSPAVNRHRLGE